MDVLIKYLFVINNGLTIFFFFNSLYSMNRQSSSVVSSILWELILRELSCSRRRLEESGGLPVSRDNLSPMFRYPDFMIEYPTDKKYAL